MVQELRRIILDKQELISALEGHRRMVPTFLRAGAITDFITIDQTSIRLTVQDPQSGQDDYILLDRKQLLKAVIRFCIENNIMLPRDGLKAVEIGEQTAALCINLDIETYFAGTMEPLRLALCAM